MKIDWIYNLIYGTKNLEISNLKKQIDELNKKLDFYIKGDELEYYYNTKYPQVNLTYKRTEIDGDYLIDLRDFLFPYDFNIPKVKGNTEDETVLSGLKWLIDNVKYNSDSKTYKLNEYWAYPYQTLKHKQGDCEDGAILLCNILLNSGIPYWKLRLSAGYVIEPNTNKKVGHCYLTYFCEESDKWVVLDWCYYPNILPIKDRKDYGEEESYLDVWFSWNQKYCFSKGLNTEAKKLLK